MYQTLASQAMQHFPRHLQLERCRCSFMSGSAYNFLGAHQTISHGTLCLLECRSINLKFINEYFRVLATIVTTGLTSLCPICSMYMYEQPQEMRIKLSTLYKCHCTYKLIRYWRVLTLFAVLTDGYVNILYSVWCCLFQ